MKPGLKALTLWRPYSDAIAKGPKRVENRSWRPPDSQIGRFIAIHAGKRYEPASWWPGGYVPPIEAECPTGIVAVARLRGFVEILTDTRCVGRFANPTHARLIGLSIESDPLEWSETIARIVLDSRRPEQELAFWLSDAWFAGQSVLGRKPAERTVGWVLDRVRSIDPVPCPGAQGLWRVGDRELRLVRNRWRRSA